MGKAGSEAGERKNPAMISVKMLQCKQNRQAIRNDLKLGSAQRKCPAQSAGHP
jgi:hypothetical protein